MNSTWGKNIRLSVFGESHGECVGIVADGFPAGIKLDISEINKHMSRRAPGKAKYSTPRGEADTPEIISGIYNGFTTGAPICCIIKNTNTRSTDYDELKDIMRPGHSDYPAYVKYKGYNDVRGGGHFSGRLTAPLVFAGSLCRQYLQTKGIKTYAHIYMINGVYDTPFDTVGCADYSFLADKAFCVLDDSKGEKMIEKIEAARLNQDSVGGIIEGMISGVPAGIGNPIFENVESVISGLLFAIPAVKGVEFGAGFGAAVMTGSSNNDPYIYDNGVKTSTNNCGGILGGITNGMPIGFKVAFKPTPTISTPQQTINIKTNQNVILSAKGRHDPCILPRGVAVVESVAAIAMTELILENGGSIWI